jgi:hypothetical protein
MAEYSFNPQFANLTGLQPISAIDVTRGGELQFQPLQAIQVPSAQPELVGQGISNALQSISQGLFGGITAKYQERKAEQKELREHERALELAGAKKKSENQDFYEKERAKFIANESGKPGFQKKLDAFDSAMEGFKSRTPDVKPVKEDEEPTPPPSGVEAAALALDTEPLPQPDLTIPQAEVQTAVVAAEKPLAPLTPPTTAEEQAQPVLAPLPEAEKKPPISTAPSTTPTPAPSPTPSPEEKKITAVDYTEYPQPEAPSVQFETDAEALNVAAELNNQLKGKNPDYRYEVINLGKPDEWKNVVPVSIRESRIESEEAALASTKEEERKTREEKREEEKLILAKEEAERKKVESQQQMEIRQQKVKDENKVLADHVENAANSLKAINKAIQIIDNNPISVGKSSAMIARIPMIDTDSSRIRGYLNTVTGQTAINAITAMRNASPTGAAVGNTSDKEMQIFRDTEGPLDPDTQTDKDILPVLREIYRKRLQIYNDSVEILKANNPEYTPPPLEYPKAKDKKQTPASGSTKAMDVPIIRSQEEFDKLPSGSEFTYPGSSKVETKK